MAVIWRVPHISLQCVLHHFCCKSNIIIIVSVWLRCYQKVKVLSNLSLSLSLSFLIFVCFVLLLLFGWFAFFCVVVVVVFVCVLLIFCCCFVVVVVVVWGGCLFLFFVCFLGVRGGAQTFSCAHYQGFLYNLQFTCCTG